MTLRISEADARRLTKAPRPAQDRRKPRKAPVVPGRGSEHAEQAAFIAMCALHQAQHPALALLYAVPNGARTSISVARRLKAEGLRAGVLDMHLPVARGAHIGLWIEFKYGKNTPSSEQEWWMDALTEQGHHCVVCYSAEAALAEVLAYLETR